LVVNRLTLGHQVCTAPVMAQLECIDGNRWHHSPMLRGSACAIASSLRRNNSAARGVPNRATVEIKELAARLTTQDKKYMENLRCRLKTGKANHIETLLWQWQFGRPKEGDQAPDRRHLSSS
jgi:hypothetical protein